MWIESKMKKKIILLVTATTIVIISLGFLYILAIKKEKTILRVSLTNPGFEAIDESGKPKFWTEDVRGGWVVDTKYPYKGKVCMQANVSWSWLEQEIPVNSERHYLLRVYVKSDIVIPGKENYQNTFLTLECIDKRGRVIYKNWGIVNASPAWELKEVRICTPGDTQKIRIKLAKRLGEGSVWFDDVKIREISVKPILNESFEELNRFNKPLFWKEDPKGGWIVDTKEAYEGKVCMQATVSWSFLSQEVPVRAKGYYALKAYVKSDIIIPGEENYQNTFLTLECLDKDNKVISRNWGIVNATSSWQLKKVDIATPKYTRVIRIKLAKRQGEGSVWFDNLKLVKLPSYLRFPFFRKILKDKLFLISYMVIWCILILFLLRVSFKKAI